MYKSHKAIKEVLVFIKRHSVICVLLIICLIVVAKNSHIPVLIWLPTSVKKLLQYPEADSVAYEWWSLFNNISLAFIASVIAYVFIQYIPERRKAYKAFNILKKELCRLYSHMSRLISMYLFEIRVEKPENLISSEDLSPICNVEISDKLRECKIQHLRNGLRENIFDFNYNLYVDSKKYEGLINKTIKQIKGSVSSANLDPDIIDAVSRIENNWFLTFLSYMDSPFKKTPGYQNVIHNFDKGLYEFSACHRSLRKYNFDLITYEFSKMSDDEKEMKKEDQLFLATRAIYDSFGASRAAIIAEGISALPPTKERLRKSNGVLQEMLVYYDFKSPKPNEILVSALRIAEYVRHNETEEEIKGASVLNVLQVKKRLNTISSEELAFLHYISINNDLTNEIIVGASILSGDYKRAEVYFNELSVDEKAVFVQCPIYRLWPNPPVPANLDPMLFLYSKSNMKHEQ